ncbi:hypothetical protein QC761_0100780 [Podospora bellae-mahoneyi]|uniref:Uncharacterized protein n=1 Tax=Podospora bellae-mahoneyi TaxID=2093777 RepID=A0ABR0FBD9_9PEZI|nr:hypothetical protein QC761_0100780 [Podospora bellae-mahoneyi]
MAGGTSCLYSGKVQRTCWWRSCGPRLSEEEGPLAMLHSLACLWLSLGASAWCSWLRFRLASV